MAALRQRGPDAEHTVFWGPDLVRTDGAAPNGLLHTRLSIIDPRPEADQPMGNDRGDVWIAYNGEVYDWAADAETLRDGRVPVPHALGHRVHPARVRALGHRFRAPAARDVRDRDRRSRRAARSTSSATASVSSP